MFKSPTISVTAIACRPDCMGCGGAESQTYHSLAFVRRGAYAFHQRGEATLVDRATAVFWAAGDEYRVSHPLGYGDDCLELRFDDAFWEEARPAMRRRQCKTRTRILPIADDIVWRLNVSAARLERRLANELEAAETALWLLAAVAAIEETTCVEEDERATRADRARARRSVERAKEILHADLSANHSLSGIAKATGASPYHLTRLFRRHTGATLHQYLIRHRLAAALDRILDGADDLTSLALDFGFSSHSHFSTAFRQRYGVAPRAARRLTESFD